MQVVVRRHLYVSSPAPAGIYCMETWREVAVVPRKDDWIELAGGWASAVVKDVTFMADGQVIVEILRTKTDSPELVAEEHELVSKHGWRWVGPAPERTFK